MYADEVSAIVVELGSHTCKAGYAGEDAPKAVFPSVVGAIDGMDIDDSANTNSNTEDAKTNAVDSDKEKGKRKFFVGCQALSFRRDQMEILSPIKDGIVADGDMVDDVWEHTFRFPHPLLQAVLLVWLLIGKTCGQILLANCAVCKADDTGAMCLSASPSCKELFGTHTIGMHGKIRSWKSDNSSLT